MSSSLFVCPLTLPLAVNLSVHLYSQLSIHFFMVHLSMLLSSHTHGTVTPYPCHCHPILMPLSSHTHAPVIPYSCPCHSILMSLSFHTHVTVIPYSCHCYSIPMSLSSHTHVTFIPYPCHCHPILVSLLFHTHVTIVLSIQNILSMSLSYCFLLTCFFRN